jgi:hypothetical protein
MDNKMITLLKKLFINNWRRKIIALLLSMIIWVFVNYSLTIIKPINEVPIKIINLPKNKTIRGIQIDGLLNKTLDIEIQGNKSILDIITKNDLEIIIDLDEEEIEQDDYTIIITRNNLISKNPDINIARAIKKLSAPELSFHLSKLVTEKIPVIISQPLGDAPPGYQFLDIWPYTLYMTVGGPEEIISNLKTEGLKLIFNLNEISQKELDAIESVQKKGKNDIVSFFVPTSWKRLTVPEISIFPMNIDDPNSKSLRFEFIKKSFIPIPNPIPIILFFPPNTPDYMNPANITLVNNDYVKKINGIDMLTIPIYAQGVNDIFLDTVKNSIYILLYVDPQEKKDSLRWDIQFPFQHSLEKNFIKKTQESYELEPNTQDPNLRLRFRSLAGNFQFWISPTKKLNLKIALENNKITIVPDQQ